MHGAVRGHREQRGGPLRRYAPRHGDPQPDGAHPGRPAGRHGELGRDGEPGALPEQALEQLIARARELDMAEVRQTLAEPAAS